MPEFLYMFRGFDLRYIVIAFAIALVMSLIALAVTSRPQNPDSKLENVIFAIIRFFLGLGAVLSVVGIFACFVIFIGLLITWAFQANAFLAFLALMAIGGLLGLGGPTAAGGVIVIIFGRK